MKFREKSPVVDAILWTGDNTTDVIDWVLETGGTARWHEAEPDAQYPLTLEHIAIDMPHGTGRVFVGEWLLRSEEGIYERCGAGIFAETYEAVEA